MGTADLAKAAGISEPALYRYFSGKKELFLATLRSTAPKLLEIWQDIASDVEDPLETLWAIGVHYYDHLQSHSGNMKIQFQAVSEADDPEIREALRENFEAFVRFVAETLDEGKRRGIVRRDVDSRLLAWQFLGIGLTLDLMHLLGLRLGRWTAARRSNGALLYQRDAARAAAARRASGRACARCRSWRRRPLEV